MKKNLLIFFLICLVSVVEGRVFVSIEINKETNVIGLNYVLDSMSLSFSIEESNSFKSQPKDLQLISNVESITFYRSCSINHTVKFESNLYLSFGINSTSFYSKYYRDSQAGLGGNIAFIYDFIFYKFELGFKSIDSNVFFVGSRSSVYSSGISINKKMNIFYIKISGFIF